MKKTITAIMLGASILGLTACSYSDTTLVQSKEGNIKESDLYKEMVEASGASTLNKMIEELVLEENYKVSSDDVNKALKEAKGQFSSDDEFKQALSYAGISDESEFKEQIKLSLLQEKAVTDGLDTSDKKLEEYYNKNKESFIYATGSHILVADENTAKEVKAKLDQGEDFAKLAKEYSTDTASAENGGALGEFTATDMVTAFSDEAFSIELNKISEPVKSDYGYHILKITKREQKSFSDAKDAVKQAYISANAKSYTEAIEELKKKSDIDIKDKDLKEKIEELAASTSGTTVSQ